ncbi:MAG: pilin [Gammaproteobacteria bacterium]
MNKAQKGFTLIELMIVIAIIGILAAIAIPQYQDYVTRSKITEGLNLSAAAQTAVAETFQSLGHMGATGNAASGNNSFGLPLLTSIAGKYVTSVQITDATGLVTISYNAQVGGGVTSGEVLTLTPGVPATGATGSVIWACGNNTVTAGGVTAVGAGTTVPSKYLPSNCRG